MSHKFIIAQEGWPFITLGIALTVLAGRYSLLASVPLAMLTVMVVWFFRNPERQIQDSAGLVVAPADGVVMSVQAVKEEKYLETEALQLRIFLNLFNVHVNRIPVKGKVEWINRTGGIHLPAYKSEAGDKNVKNCVGLLTDYGKVLVVQITGLIARRIVCWVHPGDEVNTGDRFGLIRFGSCTELYLPCHVELLVQPGDKLKGGETVIARFIS